MRQTWAGLVTVFLAACSPTANDLASDTTSAASGGSVGSVSTTTGASATTMGTTSVSSAGASASTGHTASASSTTGTVGATTGDRATTSSTGAAATSGAAGTSGTTSGAFVSAEPNDLPQVTNPLNGSVLNPSAVVSVTFADYNFTTQVDAFGDYLAQTNYIENAATQYGVGPLTNQNVMLTDSASSAPASDVSLQTWLVEEMVEGSLPAPSSSFTPIYVVYYPYDAGITGEFGTVGCVDFSGYHSAGAAGFIDGAKYYYAVVEDCGTGLGDVESTATHEIAEATTDPAALSWNDKDTSSAWVTTNTITEIGDLCEGQTIQYDAGTQLFTMQQLWSDSAAAAQQAPCVPVDPRRPYYNVAPDSDSKTAAAGSSATFTLTGYSSAPIPAGWSITGYGYSGSNGFVPNPFTLTTQSMNNGTTSVLTIGVPAGTPSGAVGGAFIYSLLGDGTSSFVPVIVTAQ